MLIIGESSIEMHLKGLNLTPRQEWTTCILKVVIGCEIGHVKNVENHMQENVG